MSEEKNQNEIEEVTNEDEHKDVEHYCYFADVRNLQPVRC